MLYIRTDMNENIATGHMMRCMAIASAARSQGIDVLFIVSDSKGEKLLKENGFKCVVLNTDYLVLMQCIDVIKDIVTERDVLLIDTYSPTKEFMDEMRGKVYTVYIDDMGEQVFNVDCIICYPPYYQKFAYCIRYNMEKTKFLLGPRYAPLREEFRESTRKTIRNNVEEILVVSGGADPYRVTPKLLETISGTGINVTAICGIYSGYYDEMCHLYNNSESRVSVIPSTAHIKELFDKSDVVITAAGSTLYELCATGTPAISYTFADNQLLNAEEFDKLGIIPYIGDARNSTELICGNCIEQLERLQSKDTRNIVSQLMQKNVSGNGADSIVRELFGDS